MNSIMVRDAFLLPHIDEALQAVQEQQLFSLFDLAQGYLQLVMEEDNIKKSALESDLQDCMSYSLAFWSIKSRL